jgi:hypothetical protein
MGIKELLGKDFTLEELKDMIPLTLKDRIVFKDLGNGLFRIELKG